MKVQNEIRAMTLLDLSAPLDIIDHNKLTDKLPDWYGVYGHAEMWFSTYLKNGNNPSK